VRVSVNARVRTSERELIWVLPEQRSFGVDEQKTFEESLRRSRREAFADLEQLN
jgi:hypothetical protein